MQTGHFTFRCLAKKNENKDPHKDVHRWIGQLYLQ